MARSWDGGGKIKVTGQDLHRLINIAFCHAPIGLPDVIKVAVVELMQLIVGVDDVVFVQVADFDLYLRIESQIRNNRGAKAMLLEPCGDTLVIVIV